MEINRTVQASVLIAEVKKHPILYDFRAHSGQNNPKKKREAWENIAANICGQSWDTYDCLEKDNIAKEVQTKWKHLRDNFTRILKKQATEASVGNSTKKKRYIYYDQMSFIKPYITNKHMINLSPNDDGDDIKEEMDYSSDGGGNPSNIIYVNEPDETNDEKSASQSSLFQPPLTSIGGSLGTLTPVQLVQINPSAEATAHAPRAAADQGCAEAVRLLAQIQQDDRLDDRMGNRRFLLSLLPFLQRMSDDVNLEVKMQLMSVVHSYTEKARLGEDR